MKIFIASISTETNTFSPVPTSYRSYAEDGYLVHKGQHDERTLKSSRPVMVFRRAAEARGWEVVDSIHANAQPSGITIRSVYEGFRDELLADLRTAMPVDMVFLPLHGAMVADGYDDCEGDIIARVREMVGPEVPIGVELDLHCHLTDLMVDNATVIIAYKEYPHTDFAERAEDLFRIIVEAQAGRVKPHMSLFDCRMIGIYHTSREPMKSFVSQITGLEGRDDVLSISVAHGFPWADVPDMGTRMLVVTDNNPQKGAALAEELGRQFFAMRHELIPPFLSVDEALDRALARLEQEPGKPVVIADTTDNPGGGAPSDSTFVLQAILERGVREVALGLIWDPIAAAIAADAGERARLDLRIGGKMGPVSGQPVDLHAEVTKVGYDVSQSFGLGERKGSRPIGDAVAIRAEGIDIILNTRRTQVVGTDCFTNMGIDPTQKRIVVVKSSQHFYAAFAPIASDVLYAAAPGTIMPNFEEIPYRRIDKNKFPLVEDPFA